MCKVVVPKHINNQLYGTNRIPMSCKTNRRRNLISNAVSPTIQQYKHWASFHSSFFSENKFLFLDPARACSAMWTKEKKTPVRGRWGDDLWVFPLWRRVNSNGIFSFNFVLSSFSLMKLRHCIEPFESPTNKICWLTEFMCWNGTK